MLEQQYDLEEEMRAVTVERYFSSHEKAEDRGEFSDTHAGRNIMNHALDNFVLGIEEWDPALIIARRHVIRHKYRSAAYSIT